MTMLPLRSRKAAHRCVVILVSFVNSGAARRWAAFSKRAGRARTVFFCRSRYVLTLFSKLSVVWLLDLICLVAPAHAGPLSFTDFEPAGFTPTESVHNHQTDGTEAVPAISNINPNVQAWKVATATTDEEIVDLSGSFPDHGKVWRMSQGGDSGSLGQAPHSPNFGVSDFAGETGANDDGLGKTVTTHNFYAEFDFRSVTGASQSGLAISAAANCHDGCRHAFVRILDDGVDGFDLVFFQTGVGGAFEGVTLDTNLSFDSWHQLGIEIMFVDGLNGDGTGNDVVNIYADDELVHIGTSWETVYWAAGSILNNRGVDRLIFANSSGTIPAQLGAGLYFDNVLVTDVKPLDAPQVPEPSMFGLLGIGVLGLIRHTWRRRRRV